MSKNRYLILSAIALTFSILFIFVPTNYLSPIYFPMVGVGFIIMGIAKLVFTNRKLDSKREFMFNSIEGACGLILGVIYYNFYRYLVIDIICFVGLAVVPVLRLIFTDHFYNQLAFDSIKYYGLFSLLGGYNNLNKPFFVFLGIILFAVVVYLLIRYFIVRREDSAKEN